MSPRTPTTIYNNRLHALSHPQRRTIIHLWGYRTWTTRWRFREVLTGRKEGKAIAFQILGQCVYISVRPANGLWRDA